MEEEKYQRLANFFAKVNIAFAALLLCYLYFNLDGIYMARIFKLPLQIYGWTSLLGGVLLYRKAFGAFISLGFLNMLLIGAEFVAYIIICFSTNEIQWEGFNRPASTYDPIAGYLWDNNDSTRIMRLAKGHVIYDQTFKPNNKGYISKTPYQFKKTDKKRYLLFGDSFSCAEFLETPISDRLNQFATNDSLNIEFYSFAQDGAGLANWHSIYFNEIKKNYEFDGIILASWFDNWQREFSVLHMTPDGGYFSRANGIKGPLAEVLPEITKQHNNIWSIASNQEMDNMKADKDKKQLFVLQPWNLYFIKKTTKAVERFYLDLKKFGKQSATKENKLVCNEEYLMEKFGGSTLRKWEEIIQDAIQMDKEVIITSIPRKMWANPSKFQERKKEKVYHQLELEYYANKYQLPYIDGYKPFHHLEIDDFMTHWLKYDGHWNQKGSDLFANYFYQNFKEDLNE